MQTCYLIRTNRIVVIMVPLKGNCGQAHKRQLNYLRDEGISRLQVFVSMAHFQQTKMLLCCFFILLSCASAVVFACCIATTTMMMMGRRKTIMMIIVMVMMKNVKSQ